MPPPSFPRLAHVHAGSSGVWPCRMKDESDRGTKTHVVETRREGGRVRGNTGIAHGRLSWAFRKPFTRFCGYEKVIMHCAGRRHDEREGERRREGEGSRGPHDTLDNGLSMADEPLRSPEYLPHFQSQNKNGARGGGFQSQNKNGAEGGGCLKDENGFARADFRLGSISSITKVRASPRT